MKSNIRNFAIATFVALVSLSPAMHAQTTLYNARVNVPFSFDYGTTHFAHGVYTLSTTDLRVLTIRSGAESAMAMIQTGWAPTGPNSSMVVFRKYGDRYFLDEVLIAGSNADITVIESKAEKRAAREVARGGSQATTLALAFLPEPTLSH